MQLVLKISLLDALKSTGILIHVHVVHGAWSHFIPTTLGLLLGVKQGTQKVA